MLSFGGYPCEQEVSRLQHEVDQLRQGLIRLGDHEDLCEAFLLDSEGLHMPCTCGYNDLAYPDQDGGVEGKVVTYTLTISEKQAQVIVQALDAFGRIHMGQMDCVLDVAKGRNRKGGPLSLDDLDEVEGVLRLVERLIGPPSGGYYGITHSMVNEDARVAFDIKQVIRHRLAWDREPQGGIYVDFDEPMRLSKLPLPNITKDV